MHDRRQPFRVFTGRRRSAPYIIAQWILLFSFIFGWRNLPRSDKSFTVNFSEHVKLAGHMLGMWGRSREVTFGRKAVRTRPSNGSVAEVQGWLDRETFFEHYHMKQPVVFRKAATKANGWNLECLAAKGTLVNALEEELAGKEIRVFADEHDDDSAEWMTFTDYEQLVTKARANESLNPPYARSFPLSSFDTCRDLLPLDMLETYHSSTAVTRDAVADQHLDRAFVFASLLKGTSTKMHADTADIFYTQVYGRKKWLLTDPKFTTKLNSYADHLNLVYVAGHDVHKEVVPFMVYLNETILEPGDVLYFPSMTFRAVYNLDDVTMGVSEMAFDPMGSMGRHWMLTFGTLLNPKVFMNVISHYWKTGVFNGYDMYYKRHEKGHRSEL